LITIRWVLARASGGSKGNGLFRLLAEGATGGSVAIQSAGIDLITSDKWSEQKD
jgi:hypothetical protein